MNTSVPSFVPYIGITDFMSRLQTQAMLDRFSQASKNQLVPHRLMVGVMMSYKTLHGKETKWSEAFPPNGEVANIFIRHPLAFNTLHYADYDKVDFFNSLVHAISSWGGDNIDAVQLDMIWPEPADVANVIHATRKQIKVILQVGKNAMEQANNDPLEVLTRLRDYEGAIDGVLFDKSMGQGKIMDVTELLRHVEMAYEQLPWLRVAVAGGLGPTTVQIAEPLIARFPNISIDAQGKLRPSGSALDPIDWSLAETYLRRAIELFDKHCLPD